MTVTKTNMQVFIFYKKAYCAFIVVRPHFSSRYSCSIKCSFVFGHSNLKTGVCPKPKIHGRWEKAYTNTNKETTWLMERNLISGGYSTKLDTE